MCLCESDRWILKLNCEIKFWVLWGIRCQEQFWVVKGEGAPRHSLSWKWKSLFNTLKPIHARFGLRLNSTTLYQRAHSRNVSCYQNVIKVFSVLSSWSFQCWLSLCLDAWVTRARTTHLLSSPPPFLKLAYTNKLIYVHVHVWVVVCEAACRASLWMSWRP